MDFIAPDGFKMKKNQWFKGSIHWYDALSGEGLVKTDNGYFIYFHKTAIDKSVKKIKDGSAIYFKCIFDTTFTQVSLIKTKL